MAIIKGINVTVQVNEQDLKEYDDLDEEHDAEQPGLEDSMLYMNSKYIEATSGAHFSINTIVLNSTKGLAQGLNLEYIVDGVSVGHEFMILKQSELEDGIWSCCSEGPSRVTKAGEEVIRPYMFSEISICECVQLLRGGCKSETELSCRHVRHMSEKTSKMAH